MKVPSIAYMSPVLRYDAEAHVVVLQHRDVETGKVTRQIPDEQAVKAYREEGPSPAPTEPPPAPATDKAAPVQPAASSAPATLPNQATISLEA